MAVGSYTVSNTSNNEDAEKVKVPPWYRQLWDIKLTIIVILAPIAFLPLPILVPTGAGKCAYAILIMATYWMTEVIPMAVTALLPVVIFPWIGIMDTKDICQNYLKDANMLFFGGLMVAVAVERWNLHKRIAMRVLMLVGTKPPWLMFGFMATTAFLSMWISNTATTAMMVPIAHAVLTELNSHRLKLKAEAAQASANDKHESIDMDVFKKDRSTKETDDDTQSNGHTSTSSKQTNAKKKKPEMDAEDAWFQKVGKGMRLSIAYAANIGGTATLTGTGPNLVLKGQIDLIYGPDTGINFTSWFVFGFPNMIVSLIVAWFLMMLIFLGPREIAGMFRRTKKGEARDSAADVVQSEYEKLGPMSFAELMVLIHFIVLALLWLTRDPEVVPGWQAILPNKFVTDSCVAITISVLLFIVPSQFPSYLFFRRKSETRKPEMAPALLDWPTIHKGIPWNVMLLLGGGFALADGCKASGLSQVIGKFFVSFAAFPSWLLVLVLCTITALFTQVTSNVATATIFLPILAELARTIQVNPLYLMLPVTISASLAFVLPVATPPNAIVFAYGDMQIIDMVKAGVVMNIVTLLILQVSMNTYTYFYFNLGVMPAWALSAPGLNTTLLVNSTNLAEM